MRKVQWVIWSSYLDFLRASKIIKGRMALYFTCPFAIVVAEITSFFLFKWLRVSNQLSILVLPNLESLGFEFSQAVDLGCSREAVVTILAQGVHQSSFVMDAVILYWILSDNCRIKLLLPWGKSCYLQFPLTFVTCPSHCFIRDIAKPRHFS